RRGQECADVSGETHRDRNRHADRQERQEDQADEDHRARRSRQRCGSEKTIMSAPPTGSAPWNHSMDSSSESGTCRRATGYIAIPPATSTTPKTSTSKPTATSVARQVGRAHIT